MLIKNLQNQKGQLLIEVLFAIALTSIILPALLTGLISSRQGISQQQQRIQAIALLKEAEEIVRNVKHQSWSNVAVDGTYHPVVVSNSWSLAAGLETIGDFERSIQINSAQRDNNGSIVASGGTIDPSTKRVDISVTWNKPYNSAAESTLYVTRYSQNAANVVTTVADFTNGTPNQTIIADNNGGEIELGSGGGSSNWCNPIDSLTSIDLSRQGVPTAISAIEGSVVTGTGGNASGPTFVRNLISGNSPVLATPAGEFDNSKANGVFTAGNFGYIATDSNSEEIKILNLTQYSNPPTNTKFLKVGAFNAPGNTQGNSVYASGNTGYMTAVDKFYTFRLTDYTQINPTAVTLAGTGKKIVVAGNYAFVAVNSITTPLQIIDISNPAAPTIVAAANITNQPGIDVAVNESGTRAYLITPYTSPSQANVLIINTSTMTTPLPLIGTGFNTNGMNPKGISIATGNRLIVVGQNGSRQYQVINTSNETTPVACGDGMTISSGAHAVSSVLQSNGYAYSYVATGDSNQELKIILGGSGGTFSNNGTFTSGPIDPGGSVVYNYFTPSFIKPIGTNIQFKVAVAQAVNNNCNEASYTFLGPDGTENSFFSGEGAIPFNTSGTYTNPGRCFKFMAYLSTTDYTSSPILYDATVNYSP
ncbi:MAG: hypothetical protein Q7T54_05520 [Candidatus Levybacteria bacterium]|nr:hypothetical protein [Candidatus Levybacteria bacterium]